MGGTIYALAGGKGGVGRTTAALNTGIALENAGYNTVVVDGDVAMTGATAMLDPDVDAGVHGILSGTDSINDAVVDGPGGVTFVPGDRSLEAFADVDEGSLARVVEPVAAAHDIVLLDTPPGLRPLHRDAYGRADGTVLLTTPTDASIEATEKTATVVDHVGGDVLGVAVTMANGHGVRGAVDELDVPPLAVVPMTDSVHDDPVVVGDGSDAAVAYERLAEAIASHSDGDDVEPVSLSTGTTATSESSGDGTSSTETAAGDATSVTSEDPDDPLEALFTEEYRNADQEEEGLGGRLGELSERFGDVSSPEALRERLAEASDEDDGGTLDSLRERLADDGDDEMSVDVGEDEDPLEELFEDSE